MPIRRSITLTVLLALPLAACSDDPDVQAKEQDVQQKLDAAWDALLEYGYARRDELAEDLEREVAFAKVELEEQRQRLAAATGDAKAALQKSVAQLADDLESTEKEVQAFRDAAKGTWEEARDRAVKAVKALSGEVEAAAADERSEEGAGG
jgi:predicted  nucleic acid-binding Zn-ribbon protein